MDDDDDDGLINSSISLYIFYLMSVHEDESFVSSCFDALNVKSFQIQIEDILIIFINYGIEINDSNYFFKKKKENLLKKYFNYYYNNKSKKENVVEITCRKFPHRHYYNLKKVNFLKRFIDR